jgi:5-methylcytosine-specific restriction protein A
MLKRLKPCANRGCPTLTTATRCQRHTKEKRRREDKRRPNSKARGYNAKWERTRTRYLRNHPICEDTEGCITKATDVHHLDGLGPLGPKGHDHTNLQALCHSHHSRVTALEQKGGWNV